LAISARVFPDYPAALRTCFEEEISGEGYFTGLAAQFSGRPRDALLMMARMERVTAAALRPLIARHGIPTADEAALSAEGAAEAAAQAGLTWEDLTRRMAAEYPAYMAEFDQLLRLAPAADQAPRRPRRGARASADRLRPAGGRRRPREPRADGGVPCPA
jgi:hypothetical protein